MKEEGKDGECNCYKVKEKGCGQDRCRQEETRGTQVAGEERQRRSVRGGGQRQSRQNLKSL